MCALFTTLNFAELCCIQCHVSADILPRTLLGNIPRFVLYADCSSRFSSHHQHWWGENEDRSCGSPEFVIRVWHSCSMRDLHYSSIGISCDARLLSALFISGWILYPLFLPSMLPSISLLKFPYTIWCGHLKHDWRRWLSSSSLKWRRRRKDKEYEVDDENSPKEPRARFTQKRKPTSPQDRESTGWLSQTVWTHLDLAVRRSR